LAETRQRAAQAKQTTWRLLDAFRNRVALKERAR